MHCLKELLPFCGVPFCWAWGFLRVPPKKPGGAQACETHVGPQAELRILVELVKGYRPMGPLLVADAWSVFGAREALVFSAE